MNERQSIVACAFVRNGGKVLVTKRADTKSFLPGKYELPGGHVQFGETLEECLIRELKEELHVEITVERPFHAFTDLFDNEHYIEVDYFVHLKTSDQKIKLNKNDHSDYKWIGESEVYTYFDHDDKEAKAIIEGFKALKK